MATSILFALSLSLSRKSGSFFALCIMVWLVVICIILLYALSDPTPRKKLVSLLYRGKLEDSDLPADLWQKRYYLVGYVEHLDAAERDLLSGMVCVRDIDELKEDAIVLMAPIRSSGLAVSLRKWEIIADLAREASNLPILFTGPTTEVVEGVTLGLTNIPCVHTAHTAFQSADNLNWRIQRRIKYRNMGYKSADIPAIIWVNGNPTALISKIKKRLDVSLVDACELTPSDVRREADNTNLNVIVFGRASAGAEYWGIYDHVYGPEVAYKTIKGKMKGLNL